MKGIRLSGLGLRVIGLGNWYVHIGRVACLGFSLSSIGFNVLVNYRPQSVSSFLLVPGIQHRARNPNPVVAEISSTRSIGIAACGIPPPHCTPSGAAFAAPLEDQQGPTCPNHPFELSFVLDCCWSTLTHHALEVAQSARGRLNPAESLLRGRTWRRHASSLRAQACVTQARRRLRLGEAYGARASSLSKQLS